MPFQSTIKHQILSAHSPVPNISRTSIIYLRHLASFRTKYHKLSPILVLANHDETDNVYSSQIASQGRDTPVDDYLYLLLSNVKLIRPSRSYIHECLRQDWSNPIMSPCQNSYQITPIWIQCEVEGASYGRRGRFQARVKCHIPCLNRVDFITFRRRKLSWQADVQLDFKIQPWPVGTPVRIRNSVYWRRDRRNCISKHWLIGFQRWGCPVECLWRMWDSFVDGSHSWIMLRYTAEEEG